MTATCSRVTVIQISLSLIIGETSSENRVNTATIKSDTENYVLTSLILYMTTVHTRKVKLESLSLEIDDNISIPNIIKNDHKWDSSGKESSATFFVSVEGRSHINSAKTKYLLDLVCSNSKLKSWRVTIHLEYFPPNNWRIRICCIGLQSETTVVFHNRI
jgi:hypothetical protein